MFNHWSHPVQSKPASFGLFSSFAHIFARMRKINLDFCAFVCYVGSGTVDTVVRHSPPERADFVSFLARHHCRDRLTVLLTPGLLRDWKSGGGADRLLPLCPPTRPFYQLSQIFCSPQNTSRRFVLIFQNQIPLGNARRLRRASGGVEGGV